MPAASDCRASRCLPRCARCSSSPGSLPSPVSPSPGCSLPSLRLLSPRRSASTTTRAGLIAGSIFAASAAAQILAVAIPPRRAVAVGSAVLVVGMGVLAVALHFASLGGLIAASAISGVGQGISFSRGLAAVTERTPAERRAEVSSAYFVVAYVAISLPVVGRV